MGDYMYISECPHVKTLNIHASSSNACTLGFVSGLLTGFVVCSVVLRVLVLQSAAPPPSNGKTWV
eukprot:COSAG01_NODE_1813_length_9172_cov_347.085528_4_plen_65_part_00